MNSPATKAINGAMATAKQNAGSVKSVKVKIKFSDKSPGLAKFANKNKVGAKAMSSMKKM
jgi:hypothetical protein